MSDPISSSLSGAEWWRRDKTTLVAALRERESGMRRLQAEAYEILAEMQSRGAQAEFGYGSLDALQTDVLNISRREASKRSRRALALHPVRGVGSTVIPVAATAAAVAEGAISDGHVDALLDMVAGIRTDVPVVEREAYEKAGVDLARVTTPKSVRSLARGTTRQAGSGRDTAG